MNISWVRCGIRPTTVTTIQPHHSHQSRWGYMEFRSVVLEWCDSPIYTCRFRLKWGFDDNAVEYHDGPHNHKMDLVWHAVITIIASFFSASSSSSASFFLYSGSEYFVTASHALLVKTNVNVWWFEFDASQCERCEHHNVLCTSHECHFTWLKKIENKMVNEKKKITNRGDIWNFFLQSLSRDPPNCHAQIATQSMRRMDVKCR